MKYIKTFEELNIGLPEINDYVICEVGDISYNISNLNLFLNNNIGQIVNINKRFDIYQIAYQNIPDDISDMFISNISNMFINKYNNDVRNMRREDIKYWSANKEELETLLSTNKYNL